MTDLSTLLGEWMARQRWYSSKGRAPHVRILGTIDGGGEADATVTTYLLMDEAPDTPVLYQVPIVARATPRDDAEARQALIGEWDGSHLYDGPRDLAYATALLRAIAGQEHLIGSDAVATGLCLKDPGRVVSSRVLSGEQSNTSLICDVADGPTRQVIAKVFRVLHHGENPDVTTQTALTRGDSPHIPAMYGSLQSTWPDAGRSDGTATGHLAFVQEFLPGLEDAWRVALQSAAADEDFTAQAYDLGVATAEVHATLAKVLPTIQARPSDIDDALSGMWARVTVAAREVPEVGAFADRIRAIYDLASSTELPRLQRIHGDLHLGQALLSPERGWILLDFEGEPLRPMDERSRPDATMRDVAGMLRSFDYVAGSLARSEPPLDARAWASASRHAFVDGYISACGIDIRAQRVLLDAFELDKAVYEAIYESRSRPTWVGIPLAAIERLVARSAPATA